MLVLPQQSVLSLLAFHHAATNILREQEHEEIFDVAYDLSSVKSIWFPFREQEPVLVC